MELELTYSELEEVINLTDCSETNKEIALAVLKQAFIMKGNDYLIETYLDGSLSIKEIKNFQRLMEDPKFVKELNFRRNVNKVIKQIKNDEKE